MVWFNSALVGPKVRSSTQPVDWSFVHLRARPFAHALIFSNARSLGRWAVRCLDRLIDRSCDRTTVCFSHRFWCVMTHRSINRLIISFWIIWWWLSGTARLGISCRGTRQMYSALANTAVSISLNTIGGALDISRLTFRNLVGNLFLLVKES